MYGLCGGSASSVPLRLSYAFPQATCDGWDGSFEFWFANANRVGAQKLGTGRSHQCDTRGDIFIRLCILRRKSLLHHDHLAAALLLLAVVKIGLCLTQRVKYALGQEAFLCVQ